MAMGKANVENKEEEELVAAPLQTKTLNEAKRCSAPSSQVSGQLPLSGVETPTKA